MNFKKTISFMIALCMCALLFCSCNKQNEEIPSGMQLITNEFADCKLYVPSDWTPLNSTEMGVLMAKAEDNSNVSLQIMTAKTEYTIIDDYFRNDYFKKLSSTYKTVALLEEECSTENIKFGKIGHGAARYVYTVESDGSVYKVMQYFSAYSGYLYILTYTAQQDLFDEHYEEIQSVVSNFVFPQ